MPNPFPGMNPYLEDPGIWPDLHHRLITAIGDALAPQVPSTCYIRIEQRAYITQAEPRDRLSRPDAAIIAASEHPPLTGRDGGTATAVATGIETVTLPLYEEVREGYIEIRDTRTHVVVTAIEVLSPTNKAPGDGRQEYVEKRRRTLGSLTSLVEIDLLRGGRPMEMEPIPQSSYRIVISLGWERPKARLLRFGIRDAFPEFSVPVRRGDPEPRLALGPMLDAIDLRARYDFSVDYKAAPPSPPLAPDDAAWVDALLRERGLRPASEPAQAP